MKKYTPPPGLRWLKVEKFLSGQWFVNLNLKLELATGIIVPDYVDTDIDNMDSWHHTPEQRGVLGEGDGLVWVGLDGVDFKPARRFVGMAPGLKKLALKHMVLPRLDWIPTSVVSLTISSCTVLNWDCCFPHVRSVQIHGVKNLRAVPPRFHEMFPNAVVIGIAETSIETLKGVVFPASTRTINISRNSLMSMRDAVFPVSLRALFLDATFPGNEFREIKIPPNLEYLSVSKNNIKWVGRDMVLPASLRDVNVSGNPMMDLRAFERFRGGYSVRDRYVRSKWYYDTEEVIMLFSIRDVLPNDLLKFMCDFLF